LIIKYKRLVVAISVRCDVDGEATLSTEEEQVEAVRREIVVAIGLVLNRRLTVECVVQKNHSFPEIFDHNVSLDL